MGFDRRENAKKYTGQDGDTLQSIAERETAAGNEITWQDLARFNWGTIKESEINEFLRDELGTRKRDGANNFVISSDDEPKGEFLIPQSFQVAGLATEKIHTLKVRKKLAPPQFLECTCIPGVTFEFDKSFIRPTVVDQLKSLEQALTKNPDSRIMIFGHTDKVGDDQYNKKLSERRAKSTFAFITNDADTWEALYNEENWGTKVIQEILADLGFDPGLIDGVDGPNTRAAIEEYQQARGLAVDGVAGPQTRKAMFTEYMTSKHDIKATPDQFMDPKHMGCGEFNPVDETEAAHEPNRRVTIFLFHKERLPKLPCKFVDLAPCKKQMTPPAPRFIATFKCSFFDSLARDCDCEGGVTPPVIQKVNPLIQPATQAVVVKKPHTNPARKGVTLKTDAAFDGSGTFTVSGAQIQFFTVANGGTALTCNGTDNVFTGAQLTAGVQLFPAGVSPSAALDDVQLTLTLAGGSKQIGPPATATMTAVEVTLDICMSRTAVGVDPTPLSANDKVNTGRFVHVQDAGNQHGRAMLIVRQAQPAAFAGTLSLVPLDGKVRVFDTANEVPAAGQAPLANPHEMPNGAIPANGLQLWAEGAAVSAGLRDTGFRLGIKDLEPDGDRVAVTVVRLRDLLADIPSTPAHTPRLGNSPVARHTLRRGSGAAVNAADFNEDFIANVPLVLLEGAVQAADSIHLSVNVDPAGVPVSWSIQRADDDHANIGALSPKPLPTLTPDAGNRLAASLVTDAVGSFHIRPYVDCNGNGRFDHHIDREPFILMNLVLVRVTLQRDDSIARSTNFTVNPAAGGIAVSSGAFNIAAPNTAAIHLNVQADVVGGGGDGRRGVDRVFAGWINNESANEDIVGTFRDASVAPPANRQSPSVFASNRAAATGAHSSGSPAFLPSDPAPALVAPPLLDTGRGGAGSGGDTATLTRSRIRTRTNLALGQRFLVETVDSPGDGEGPTHPGFAAAQLVRFRFGLDFSAYLGFWTNITRNSGATGDPADRLYSVLRQVDWRIRGEWTVNPATGAITVVTAPTVQIAGSITFNPLAPAVSTAAEVRPSTGLSLLARDCRA
jgi:hypothetical protein